MTNAADLHEKARRASHAKAELERHASVEKTAVGVSVAAVDDAELADAEDAILAESEFTWVQCTSWMGLMAGRKSTAASCGRLTCEWHSLVSLLGVADGGGDQDLDGELVPPPTRTHAAPSQSS